jgi:hypothetical protein
MIERKIKDAGKNTADHRSQKDNEAIKLQQLFEELLAEIAQINSWETLILIRSAGSNVALLAEMPAQVSAKINEIKEFKTLNNDHFELSLRSAAENRLKTLFLSVYGRVYPIMGSILGRSKTIVDQEESLVGHSKITEIINRVGITEPSVDHYKVRTVKNLPTIKDVDPVRTPSLYRMLLKCFQLQLDPSEQFELLFV